MPELPEVETVRRGLAAAMEGRTLVRVDQRRPDLRFPFPEKFAERLTGRRIIRLRRRAKYLVCDLDGDDGLLMHLGMSGRFTIENDARTQPGRFHHGGDQPAASSDRHVHVVFHLDDAVTVAYADPRRFGFMDFIPGGEPERSRFLAGLGPEPLGNEFNAPYLAAALAGRKTSLKSALLDQHLIAGVGNIYACEALHEAGLSPRRLARTLVTKAGGPRKGAVRLADAVRAVLDAAIAAGGSSLRDFAHADGELGYFQHAFKVYDRDGDRCPKEGCGGMIARIVQSGRSTFYCPRCQR